MTRNEFDEYCRSLVGSTHSADWGEEASIWKVGDVIFAVFTQWEGESLIHFKCDPIVFDVLKDYEGYNASSRFGRQRWLQVENEGACEEKDLQEFLHYSYSAVQNTLTTD